MEDFPSEKSKEKGPPSEVGPSRYQFNLWQILLLTLLVSLLAAWLRLLPYREDLIWIYLIYFGVLIGYVVLRIPYVTQGVLRAQRTAEKSKADALAFAEEARRRKRAGEQIRPED